MISGASTTYAWKRVSDNASLGSTSTLAVGAVTQTTSYSLTVNDACNSAVTFMVTISVPLAMTTTDLVAAASADRTRIVVTWPAVSGATQYQLTRRGSDGSVVAWTLTSASYQDQNVNAAVVYAYQAQLTSSSSLSNVDLATTGTFLSVVAGDHITPATFAEMLRAVNSVRAISGWPSLTWATMLSPADPVVGQGNGVAAQQVLAARARMNEAMQAVGALTPPYSDADLAGIAVKAIHVNEVHQRTQ